MIPHSRLFNLYLAQISLKAHHIDFISIEHSKNTIISLGFFIKRWQKVAVNGNCSTHILYGHFHPNM